jgi:hypothetical protein
MMLYWSMTYIFFAVMCTKYASQEVSSLFLLTKTDSKLCLSICDAFYQNRFSQMRSSEGEGFNWWAETVKDNICAIQ